MTESDVETVRRLAINWGEAQSYPSFRECPPDARVVTGDIHIDTLFYYFELESGIQVKVTDDHQMITGYDIIDHKKFTWFTLKWM